MLVVVFLQWNGIFYPHNLLFLNLDFSHSSYIMLHGATAKWRFLVFFVFSLQRGAPFLMYGMVDSSFINNELCVCVFECVFSWIRHLRAFEESAAQRSWHGRFFFVLASELIRTAKSCFCPRPGSLWVHVPRQVSLCSGRNIGSVSRIAREDL